MKLFKRKPKCEHKHRQEYTHINIDGVTDHHAMWCLDCGEVFFGKRPTPPRFSFDGDM